jgi:hypothetical protein
VLRYRHTINNNGNSHTNRQGLVKKFFSFLIHVLEINSVDIQQHSSKRWICNNAKNIKIDGDINQAGGILQQLMKS